jgi:adenylate cyclase
LAIPRSTAPARERGALRPLVGVLPLQIMPREEALHAVATHVASEIAHGLWRSGICDVVELDCQASGNVLQGPELSYALRGNLMQLKDGLRLSLRCVEPRRGTVLWFTQIGPDRSTTGRLAGWIGKAVGALQSSIQITEMHRAQECSNDPDQGVRDLLLKVLALSAAPELVANRQALAFLDTVLTEEPDEPRALALAAWCHAQRCVYNWSANPDGDRSDAERFIKAASHLGMNDPNCLTALAAARSPVADQTHAGMLLSRALQLNPHSSWAHARSGYVAVYQDQPERAVHHFRAALQLAPLDPATFNSMAGLGIAYFIKGEHRRAIDWMEQGLALSPKANLDLSEPGACLHCRRTAGGG